jgi:hypothetical protein
MEKINDLLNTFKPITLKEMESVALLDRLDTKFIYHIDRLPTFLEKLSNRYNVLEINNIRASNYETMYFDTDNFYLFNQHHNGRRNRYKIRFRSYLDSNINFFEIKLKNNKNRTIKKRIKNESVEIVIKDGNKDFLIENVTIDPDSLSPKLWVYYSRITLVNKCSKERLTIDIDLNFKNNNLTSKYPYLVITELKQNRAVRSDFLSLMRENHILPVSISKFCLGITSLEKNVKKNNFKYHLLSIKKLCHD